MRTAINRVLSRMKRKPVTTENPVTLAQRAEHFEPILDEVRAFETNFNDILRPTFKDYSDAVHEPLIASEKRIMETAMQMQELCHELAAVAPDLIRAARRDHPLTIPQISTNDHMERDGPWNR